MRCPKCKGRMYSEKYYDFVRAFDAWKCCSCGEVVDPTILANRARNHNVFLGYITAVYNIKARDLGPGLFYVFSLKLSIPAV